MAKTNQIIVPKELFEKFVNSLNESHPAAYYEKIRLDGLEIIDEAAKYIDIDVLTLIINDDLALLIENIYEILKDGKLNLSDASHVLKIAGALTNLMSRLPEAGRELASVNIQEIKLLIINAIDTAFEAIEK